MPGSTPFPVHEVQLNIRFLKGYRYLDRCGAALVKLEDTLEPGWITSEPTPQGGSIKNDQLGMTASFNAEGMNVRQGEFISFGHFLSQSCMIFDVLWQTFGIARINVPAMRVIFQKGFDVDNIDEASLYLLSLNTCTPSPELAAIIGGMPCALDFVLVNKKQFTWNGSQVPQRCRLESKVVRQEKQPPFDMRLLARSRLLGEKQNEAIRALMQLRRQHPEVAPVAAQLDAEWVFDTEFAADGFDLPDFLDLGWKWANAVCDGVGHLERKVK